jgi:transposase
MGSVPVERAKKIRGRAASVLCVFRLRKGASWRGDYQDRIRWSAKVFF